MVEVVGSRWKSVGVIGSQQQRVFVVVGSCRESLGAIGSHWESLGAVGVNFPTKVPSRATPRRVLVQQRDLRCERVLGVGGWDWGGH